MFLIINKDIPINFWANSPEDIFILNTIKNLKLNKEDVELYFYPNLGQIPGCYRLTEEKALVIQNKTQTFLMEPQIDESGNPVLDESGSPVMIDVLHELLEDIETIQAISYFSKGIMLKPC